ncbi:MAG TPA: hypothetical protein VEZ26_10960 [Sphingomonadaceae bacterium]|nr:hypothetical protein [Sphingomonadaceae bacterium]
MIRGTFAAMAIMVCCLGGPALAEDEGCHALRRGVAAGDFVTTELAKPVPCQVEQPRLPLAFERSANAPVAVEDLPAGTYLGRLALKPGAIAPAGGTLKLVIRTGPVIVEREVSAIRPIRAGDHGFVKAGDGQVLSARFVDGAAAQ